jgi:hypothetical protein
VAYAHLSPRSDVYVILTEDGVTCMNCTLNEDARHTITATPAAMIRHLLDHRAAGDKVQDETLQSLTDDISPA